jgi:signal transduction histidine kinase
LTEAAIDSLGVLANKKKVQLLSSKTPGRFFVLGDEARLFQVLVNLLMNGIKFTPEGGRVEVELRTREREVQLLVKDTGVGISAALLPRVFDRFLQGNGGQGGCGLGLSIARDIVERHGGVLSAHSDGEGRGATFRVQLCAASP